MKKRKTETPVNIYDSSIIDSQNFQNKIRKIINGKLNECGYKNADVIDVISVGMIRHTAYGQYSEYVEIEINSFNYTVRRHSTDSPQYDMIYNDDLRPTMLSNELKRLCLRTLESKIERLVDEVIDNKVVQEKERERA